MEALTFGLYVHLIPESDNEIRESFKISLNSELKVHDLVKLIEKHLEKRNVRSFDQKGRE